MFHPRFHCSQFEKWKMICICRHRRRHYHRRMSEEQIVPEGRSDSSSRKKFIWKLRSMVVDNVVNNIKQTYSHDVERRYCWLCCRVHSILPELVKYAPSFACHSMSVCLFNYVRRHGVLFYHIYHVCHVQRLKVGCGSCACLHAFGDAKREHISRVWIRAH